MLRTNRLQLTTQSWRQPAGRSGGDLVLFYETPTEVRLIFGDVCGHGEAVSPMADAVRSRLGRDLHRPISATMMRRWNRELRGPLAGSFVCLTCVEIDLKTGKTRIANAGNPAVLVTRGSGRVEAFATTGMVLGLLEDEEWSAPRIIELTLDASDRIVCFTDGLTERHGPNREEFGLERVKRAVSRNLRSPLRALRRWVAAFQGDATGQDDLTVLCLQPAAQAA